MTSPESLHPMGPDAPHEDYLGLAIGSLALGVLLGIGCNAVVGLGVRTLQAGRPPARALTVDDPVALTLFVGTLASCLIAAVTIWRVMAPVKNAFRQGMFAMVGFFASFMASLLAMGADRLAGRLGTGGLAVVAFGLAAWVGRRLAASS